MSVIGAKVRTAWGLSFRMKLWLVVLYPLSGCFRLASLVFPFRWIASFLGEAGEVEGSWGAVSEGEAELAREVGRMCALASRYAPWESKCLVQALMARTLLGVYGIPYVVRLGVRFGERKGDDSGMEVLAHAWTQVGDRVVTGGKGHAGFRVLSSYRSRF